MLKLLPLIILSLLLTGCTFNAERIYTVCKDDGENVYVFDTNDNFYLLKDDTLINYSGVGLKSYPALVVEPRECDYVFTYVLPGLYEGTLESVNGYLHKLVSMGGTYIINYRDWNNIDIYVTNAEFSTRIIFNIQGQVRIYAVDNSNNSIDPLYLLKE